MTAPAVVNELPSLDWRIGYLRELARSLAYALADAHADMDRAGVWHVFMEGSIAEGLAKWTDADWARVYAEARGEEAVRTAIADVASAVRLGGVG